MSKLFEVKGVQGGVFTINAEHVVAVAPNSVNAHELCNVWFDSGDPWMLDVPYEQFVQLWKQALEDTQVFEVPPPDESHKTVAVDGCYCDGCDLIRRRAFVSCANCVAPACRWYGRCFKPA